MGHAALYFTTFMLISILMGIGEGRGDERTARGEQPRITYTGRTSALTHIVVA